MAGWFGPVGECGCCECYCDDDPSVVAPVISGNLSVKTTISGLPASFEYYDIKGDFGGAFAFYARYVVTGLDQFNGTYFSSITRQGCGLVADFFSDVISITVDRYRRGHTGAFTDCDWDTEIYESTYEPNHQISIGSIALTGILSAIAFATSPDVPLFASWAFPELFARTVLRCSKSYDMYEATDTTSFKSQTYSVNSGDIWLYAGTRMECSNPGPDLNNAYVIGSIESEIVVV